MAEALKVCRDKLFLFKKDSCSISDPFPPFAVLTDFGSLSLWKVFEKKIQMLHLTSSGSENFRRIYDRKPDIVYKDLEGLPCILILLEKGRMGDTIPGSFNCLDLRMRTSENCSTCIQELGRVCRYPAFSNTRKIGVWGDINQTLRDLHTQTLSRGYGSGGLCPEEGCDTHDASACQPKTKEVSGKIPLQLPATHICWVCYAHATLGGYHGLEQNVAWHACVYCQICLHLHNTEGGKAKDSVVLD